MDLKKQNILIIAGEKSGEDHAMTFFPDLKKMIPSGHFFGVGGEKLKSQGVELLYHCNDFSSVGIVDVLKKIFFYLKALNHIVSEVERRDCKHAILIDFQGFNMKLAKKLEERGVKVLYYVAPQAWVWKPWRAKVIEQTTHTLFTILPFEKKWFKDRGVKSVKGVVHPLKIEYGEDLKNIPKRSHANIKGKKCKVLLLPGSRNSEVAKLISLFIESIELLGRDRFEIGLVKASSVREENFQGIDVDCEWSDKDLVSALNWSDISIAASGTVTLATGLFQVPTVVVYKLPWFDYCLLKMLIPYKGPASLTNIILDNEMVFPECIQTEATAEIISKNLVNFIDNGAYYDETVRKLSKISEKLSGDDFSVSEYMADVVKQ